MAEKIILLAQANLPMAGELKAALGESWTVTVAANGPTALAALEKQHFSVLLAEFDLFGADGGGFANFFQKTSQRTIRLVMATEADRARVLKEAPGQHLFIAKPCDAAALKNIIERALALDIWIANDDVRKLVSQVRAFPAMPSLYLEIQAALRSPKVTTEQVSGIIARDMAMTTKLLQTLNSAGFGRSRQVTDLNEAVGLLGFELIKSLVITIKLISEYDHVKPVYYSIDRLWRRSTEVARLARELAFRHTGDAALANAAFAAGLLHDVGKAVLAGSFDEQYQAVQMVAREQQAPVWEIEKKNFGASHGEIGAYLLSLWGMPLDLLEAVALHDHPSRSRNPHFSPLTAVHVAHVWEQELNPENDGSPAPKIDGTHLDEVGVYDRLAGWRKAMSLPASNTPVAASAHRPAGQKTHSAPLRQQERAPNFAGAKWPLAAAGAGVLLLLGVFAFGPIARVAARFQDRAADGPTVKSAADTSPKSVSDPAIATNVAQAGKLPPTAIPSAATNTSATISAQTLITDIVFPELKLSGIFFSSDSPSAIINGQLVHVNGDVGGVHVVEIGPSKVTVEYQEHRKTLSL